MIDESNVIKKYVRGINFLKKIPPRVEDTSTATSRDTSDVESETFSVSAQSNAGSDTIRSCESVLKIFTFKSKTFNKNNEKCLAFWNAINKRDDIAPVNCIIIDANNNKRDSECQTEEKESEASLWARALHELRKRKLDKLALVTSSETCTYCKTINCPHKSPVFSPKDLLEHDDLTELNDWSPRTSNKTTQFSFKDTGSKDVATAFSESRVLKVVSLCTSPLKDNTMKKIYSQTKSGDSYLSNLGRTSDQNLKITRLSATVLEMKRSGSAGFASCNTTISEAEKVSMIPLLSKLSDEQEKSYPPSVSGLLKNTKKYERKHTETKKKVGISDIALKSTGEGTKTHGSKKSKKAKVVQPEESPPKVPPTLTETKKTHRKLVGKISPPDLSTLSKNVVEKKHLSTVSFKLPEDEKRPSAEVIGIPIKQISFPMGTDDGKDQKELSEDLTNTPVGEFSEIDTELTVTSIKQISFPKKTDDDKAQKKLSQELTNTPVEDYSETVSNDGSAKCSIDERMPTLTTSLKEVGGTRFENFNESLLNLAITDGKNMRRSENVDETIALPSDALDISDDPGKKQEGAPSSIPNFQVDKRDEDASAVISNLDVETHDGTSLGFSNLEAEPQEDTSLGFSNVEIEVQQGGTAASIPSMEVEAPTEDSLIFIPNSEIEAEKKSEEKVEQNQYREQSTGTQRLSSLLHIDTVKTLEMMVKERKEKLEQQLRSGSFMGSTSSEKEDADPKVYLCPCLSTLKKSTCEECPCKKGICTKPTQSDLQIMERVLEQVPEKEKRSLKCFLKILYKVKDIMQQNLDTETMDARIVKTLTGLDPCECEEGPCECKIHHLDVGIMRDDRNFMAATILDKFNRVLSERLEAKLGEVIKKKPSMRHKGIKPENMSVANIGVPVNRPCNICKLQKCACITK